MSDFVQPHSKTVKIWLFLWIQKGLLGWLEYKESACNAGDEGDTGSILGWEDPLEKKGQPIQVFLPGESHGQRSLVGCSPWSCKESDTTEQLSHAHEFKKYWMRLKNKKIMGQCLPSRRWCTHSQVSMYLSYLYWLLCFPCNKVLLWDFKLIKVYYAWKHALGTVHSCVTKGRIYCSFCNSSNLTEHSGSPGICKFIDAEQAFLYDCLFFKRRRKGLTCWHQVRAPV